jgi:site-specific recombinase XerD
MQKQVEEFLKAYEPRKRPLTLRAYRSDVYLLLTWLHGQGIRRWQSVRREHLVKWWGERMEAVCTRTSVRNRCSHATFFAWLKDTRRIRRNPMDGTYLPRRPHTLPVVLSPDQIAQLCSTVDIGHPLGIRDRALFELAYSSGLAVSDATALTWNDIDLEQRTLRLETKGVAYQIPMSGIAVQWLDRLYAVRAWFKPKCANVFLNYMGKGLHPTTINEIFRVWRDKAGVDCRATFYALRHSLAAHLLDSGASLLSVQAILRHQNIHTTEHYRLVCVETMRKEYRKLDEVRQ